MCRLLCSLLVSLAVTDGAAPKAFSLFVGQMLTYVYQSNGWTLAFLTPQMSIVPNNQTLTIPLAAHTCTKIAIQFTPLLVCLGIAAGIGMTGKIASSTTF